MLGIKLCLFIGLWMCCYEIAFASKTPRARSKCSQCRECSKNYKHSESLLPATEKTQRSLDTDTSDSDELEEQPGDTDGTENTSLKPSTKPAGGVASKTSKLALILQLITLMGCIYCYEQDLLPSAISDTITQAINHLDNQLNSLSETLGALYEYCQLKAVVHRQYYSLKSFTHYKYMSWLDQATSYLFPGAQRCYCVCPDWSLFSTDG